MTRLGNTRRTKPIVRHSSPRQFFKANDLSFAHGFDRIVRPYRFRSPKTVSFALIVRLNRSYRYKILLNSWVLTVVKAPKSPKFPHAMINHKVTSLNSAYNTHSCYRERAISFTESKFFTQTWLTWRVSNKENTQSKKLSVSYRDGTLAVHMFILNECDRLSDRLSVLIIFCEVVSYIDFTQMKCFRINYNNKDWPENLLVYESLEYQMWLFSLFLFLRMQ